SFAHDCPAGLVLTRECSFGRKLVANCEIALRNALPQLVADFGHTSAARGGRVLVSFCRFLLLKSHLTSFATMPCSARKNTERSPNAPATALRYKPGFGMTIRLMY